MKRWAIVAAFLVTFASPGQGQGARAPKSETQPGATKIAKIRELIVLIGGPSIALDMMKSQVASIKTLLPFPSRAQDDFEKEFLASLNINELVDLVVPIYDRHLAEKDIDGMLAFYRSPLGQRVLQALPTITAESQKAGQEWGQSLGRRIGEKIGEKIVHGDYGPWPPEHKEESPEKH